MRGLGMKTAWRYILLAVIIVSLLTVSIASCVQYRPPHTKPGPAVDRIRFKAVAQEIAPASLEKGDIDLYLYTLRTATVKELTEKPEIKVYKAPSTSIAILLNPAPAPEGELNPLAIREVRFALQYIMNRKYIASEIYGGMAIPMVAHVSSYDLDYLVVYDIIKRYNIHYDPELAKDLISKALTKAGAMLKDGRWYYKGKPIRLKFIIRVEDERREIGDLIAAELENLGFTVERIYQLFAPAILRVYGTDPKALEWHLYTEGWGKATVDKYDYATINQMYAPWFGNMPGWQEVGYWQYENPELDTICKKIFRGEFVNLQERNDLYRKATEIGIRESVRIWVAAVVNSFPAKADLKGVTVDLAAGPRSLWTLREAYFPNKSELNVGHLWVWTERSVWNPIGGFTDVYSVDIWRNVHDPPIWRHPFTGEPMPFRVEYRVETAGPSGRLDVPPEAFIWNASTHSWVTVGSGVKARSKVTFNYANYLNSKWHHGQRVTMADIIYSIYQSFDLTYNPDKSKIEYAIAAVNKPYLEVFRGFNMVNETALEVYLDYWHFDPNYIAEYASLTGVSMPWEVMAAMDTLVFEKRRAAYSDTAAARFTVPWLSLVERKHALLVKNVLDELLAKKSFPKNVFTIDGKLLVNVEEAVKRYEASIAWFKKYGHLVISNGPFMLVRFDPAAQYAELEAFRDPSYPFKPGRWFFGVPKLVEIVEVKGGKIIAGSEGNFTVRVKGPGNLKLKYLLIDVVKAEVLEVGEGRRVSSDEFSVELSSELTAKLMPGRYQLVLAAYSDEVSFVAERVEMIDVTPSPSIEVKATSTPTQPPRPTQLTGVSEILLTVCLAAGVLIVAILMFRRKGRWRKDEI